MIGGIICAKMKLKLILGSEEDVVKIVEAAKKFNVCLLPFGGGTNVSLALQMGKEERMLCSVDTSQMVSCQDIFNVKYMCNMHIWGLNFLILL